MGGYYALAQGEEAEVAQAITDHYSPAGPNDKCPTEPVSIVVALADKIDSLVCFFGINEKPTGSKDPFALRRAALGVIRLILENNFRIPLHASFGDAVEGYGDHPGAPLWDKDKRDSDEVADDLLSFFADRLKVHLREQGVPHDHIDAVFALGGEDDLVRLLARVEALGAFLKTEDGGNLLVAYRRAANILRIEEKKDGQSYSDDPDEGLLQQDEEKALFESLGKATPDIDAAITDERFDDAMARLAQLRDGVDSFFDAVTVNCDDPDLRVNRLRLLSKIRRALDQVADFSKIEGGEK
jgi:glycyl-tRNA synthetase beta chain